MTRLPSFITRLIASQVVAMSLIWAGLLLALFFVMNRYENGDLDHRMSYFASILAETAAAVRERPGELAARVKAVETVFVDGVIEELENAEHYEATYQILDRADRVIYRTGAASGVSWSSRDGFGEHTERGIHYRTVRSRSVDGTISVVVAESDSNRWASVWPMLRIIGGSQIVIFIACIAALAWAARRGIRPIDQLARAVAVRRPGDLDPMEDRIGYRETAPLVAALNDLLARESRRLDTERGFLADAAHELRTPLASLTAIAHQLTAAQTESTRRACADQLEHGVQRISHLLSQLLLTARIDASPALLAVDRVDGAELVRQTLGPLVSQARRKSISLSLDAPEAALVAANAVGLRAIVENLVDNAIRYTPSGGAVEVALHERGAWVDLTVRDSGPGIERHLHDAVFERFYRIPGTEPEGSGLGLSIVRRLAEAYRGQIRLGPGLEGRGLEVALTLPAAHPAR